MNEPVVPEGAESFSAAFARGYDKGAAEVEAKVLALAADEFRCPSSHGDDETCVYCRGASLALADVRDRLRTALASDQPVLPGLIAGIQTSPGTGEAPGGGACPHTAPPPGRLVADHQLERPVVRGTFGEDTPGDR